MKRMFKSLMNKMALWNNGRPAQLAKFTLSTLPPVEVGTLIFVTDANSGLGAVAYGGNVGPPSTPAWIMMSSGNELLELIPDPEFNDASKWNISITSGSVTVSGGLATWSSAQAVVTTIPAGSAVIGNRYQYSVTANSFTGGLITATFGDEPIWTGAFGAGTFTGEIIATTTEGLVIGAAFGATAVLERISVKSVA